MPVVKAVDSVQVNISASLFSRFELKQMFYK